MGRGYGDRSCSLTSALGAIIRTLCASDDARRRTQREKIKEPGGTEGPTSPSQVGFTTSAAGINASGQITGIYNPALGQRGFLYNNGTYSTIDTGTTTTAVMGINAASQIVGYDFNIIFSVHVIYTKVVGFLYTNGAFTTVD